MSFYFALGFLAFTSTAFADATFKSPDGKFTVNVVSETNAEIYATVTNTAGKVLAEVNLISQSTNNGRQLAKAAWSKDSRFFVFTTESSGGHSPWHYSSFFYSRSSETFRSLDDRSGLSVASESFTIDATDTLHFQAYNFATQAPEAASVSLPHLEIQRSH
jgi:hypothetical protein